MRNLESRAIVITESEAGNVGFYETAVVGYTPKAVVDWRLSAEA